VTDTAAPGMETVPRDDGRGRLLRLVSIELFALVGAATVVVVFVDAVRRDLVAIDLWQFYVAAQAIWSGDNPYVATPDSTALWGGPYPYPPLPALLATPLTVLPFQAAGLLVMGVLVCVALAVPYVLGVRDWRCYGLLLVWPSTMQAIQTGNVTLWFALAAAIAWRLRDRRLPPAASVGVTLATKFYLWPLVVWFVATRRVVTAALAVSIGVALLLASWAVIGFTGFTGYPALLRRLEEAVGPDSYTVYVVALDLGLPSSLARALWLAVGLGLLALLVMLARKGDELSAYVVAIAAALALTPVVWLHYFALFLVVIALAQPRLGILWFLPLGMVLTPGAGHPTPFQTAWTVAVAVAIVALSLRSTLGQARTPVVETRADLALGEA
jgi:Glycosyltransferase family 87